MRDLISKANVLETFADLYDVFEDNKAIRKELDKVYDRINALPYAEPKKGKWKLGYEKLDDGSFMDYPDSVECSECGFFNWCGRGNVKRRQTNYCPNCGAKMIEEE